MRAILLTLCAALAFGAPVLAAAQTPPPVMTRPAPPADPLVTPQQLDLARIFPPPPADDSLAGLADLEAVLGIQAIRTREQEAEARVDADLGAYDWARSILGEGFDAVDYPLTTALLERVRRDGVQLVWESKGFYPRRDRPVERDERVWRSLGGGHNDSSYPSARALGTRIWAGVLADVFPSRADDLMEAADRSAWMRVTGGAHYPTDIAASRILGDAFLTRLRANPEYQRLLAQAREEARIVRAP